MSDGDGSDEAGEAASGGEGRTDVAVRDSIYERVEARVERSDFESPAHYIEFAMEEVLARVEGDEPMGEAGAADARDGEGEPDDEVESRLESLGYT